MHPKWYLCIIIQVGNATPSNQDYEITKRLEEAAKVIGIELLDHIVIGNNEYISIKTIEKWKSKLGKEWNKKWSFLHLVQKILE